MRLVGSILLFLAIFASDVANGQQLYFQHYTVEDGLTSSTIYDIHQDHRGFIWMCTEAGVSRFDGIRFINYAKEDGLGDNEVFKVFEDAQGRIWFLSQNGRLSYFQGEHIINESVDVSLKATRCNSGFNVPFEDEDNSLWIGTSSDGVIKISEEFTGKIPFGDGQKVSNISVIQIKGDTIVGASGDNRYFYTVNHDQAGPYLELKREFCLPEKEGANTVLGMEVAQVFTQENTKLEWPRTADNKLYEYRDSTLQLLLEGSRVTDVILDRDGNLWLSTLGQGMYMKSAMKSSFYNSECGLSKDEIYGLARNEDELLIGHNDGTLDLMKEGSIRNINTLKNLKVNYSRILKAVLHEGNYWLVTDRGIFKWTKTGEMEGPWQTAAKCLDISGDNIYFGTWNGLYHAKLSDPSYANKIWSERTISVKATKNEGVWFGTQNGLYSYKEGKVVNVSESEVLLQTRIRDIEFYKDGLICGTHGEGLVIYSPNASARKVSMKNGLSSNICHDLLRENDSTYWMASNYGLNRIRFSGEESIAVIDQFNHENGLISNYVNSILVEEGQVWAGTDKGLSLLDTRALGKETKPPVFITQIKINERDTAILKEYTLEHDQNKLEFSFTGISLRSGENTKFKYILEGADENWTIGSVSSVKFQSLRPGNYLFKVKTVSSSGLQSKNAAEIKIKINKPIWNETWFRLLAALIIGLAIWRIVLFVLKYNERKNFEERNKQIQAEKRRSDQLLLNILPAETAEELKSTGMAQARSFEQVSVFFSDFKGFTKIASKMSPEELVAELHTCFKGFDEIIEKYGVEKIKTIGDAYMCASGLTKGTAQHAAAVIDAAIEITDFMNGLKAERILNGKPYFEARIGVNTGPVVAGVVGTKKFAFDIWGDAVNTASRMETASEVGRINISKSTYELVKDFYDCEYRGKIAVKNKGEIDMYFVLKRKD